MKFKFKNDKYKNARGGYSRLLELHCRKCNHLVALYQKDGKGSLLRMYFDRILSPDSLINLQTKSIIDIPILKCPNCDEILGTSYIYPKEKRKAFRLYHDAVTKKLRKIN